MYYCKNGKNDAHFIISRMKVIPEGMRREVTNHYEKLVKPNSGYSGRNAANEYLKAVANEYRPERPERVIKLKPKAVIKPKGKREYTSKCGLWSKEV
jgi:hypothetical protein